MCEIGSRVHSQSCGTFGCIAAVDHGAIDTVDRAVHTGCLAHRNAYREISKYLGKELHVGYRRPAEFNARFALVLGDAPLLITYVAEIDELYRDEGLMSCN